MLAATPATAAWYGARSFGWRCARRTRMLCMRRVYTATGYTNACPCLTGTRVSHRCQALNCGRRAPCRRTAESAVLWAACARRCVCVNCVLLHQSVVKWNFLMNDAVHGYGGLFPASHVIMWLQCELSSFDAMSRPSFLLIIIIIMIIIIIIIIIKSTTNDESYHVMTF